MDKIKSKQIEVKVDKSLHYTAIQATVDKDGNRKYQEMPVYRYTVTHSDGRSETMDKKEFLARFDAKPEKAAPKAA
jgi:hypothetical protein